MAVSRTYREARKREIFTPEQIVDAARRDPTDRVLAIGARCVQCRRGSAEGVRDCRRLECSLFALRPYQANVPPRSAPHCAKLPPTYEPLSSLEPDVDE